MEYYSLVKLFSQLTDVGEGEDNERNGTSDSSNLTSKFLPVSAKQEVVQKARKFLKRLTPEETGHDHSSSKGTGPKGASTCINAPVEVKSLVIMSRATRYKEMELKLPLNPIL